MEHLAASMQRALVEMGESVGAKIDGLETRLTKRINEVEDRVMRLENSSARRLDLVEDDMRRVKTELHM